MVGGGGGRKPGEKRNLITQEDVIAKLFLDDTAKLFNSPHRTKRREFWRGFGTLDEFAIWQYAKISVTAMCVAHFYSTPGCRRMHQLGFESRHPAKYVL